MIWGMVSKDFTQNPSQPRIHPSHPRNSNDSSMHIHAEHHIGRSSLLFGVFVCFKNAPIFVGKLESTPWYGLKEVMKSLVGSLSTQEVSSLGLYLSDIHFFRKAPILVDLWGIVIHNKTQLILWTMCLTRSLWLNPIS